MKALALFKRISPPKLEILSIMLLLRMICLLVNTSLPMPTRTTATSVAKTRLQNATSWTGSSIWIQGTSMKSSLESYKCYKCILERHSPKSVFVRGEDESVEEGDEGVDTLQLGVRVRAKFMPFSAIHARIEGNARQGRRNRRLNSRKCVHGRYTGIECVNRWLTSSQLRKQRLPHDVLCSLSTLRKQARPNASQMRARSPPLQPRGKG